MYPDYWQYRSKKIASLIDHPLFNFIWFYSIWLLLVLGKNQFISIFVVLMAFHYFFVRDKRYELTFVSICAVIGIAFDGLLSYTGVFIFDNNILMPPWLICLWFAFPSALTRGLRFLNKSWLLCVVLGGFGGASSYLSGAYFGAVEFGYDTMTTGIILVVHWAILFPVLMYISSALKKWKIS